jgi:hypothetical protein
MASVFVPALDSSTAVSRTRYHAMDPGIPLNGPTTQLVIQPPSKPGLRDDLLAVDGHHEPIGASH